MLKACVFIDGENLRKTINDLFPDKYNPVEHLPKKADWNCFLKHICKETSKELWENGDEELYLLRCYWYVINELSYNTKFLSSEFNDLDLIKRYNYFKGTSKSSIGDITGIEESLNRGEIASRELMGKAVDRAKKHLTSQHTILQNRLREWKECHSQIESKTQRLQFQRFGHISVELDTAKFNKEKSVDIKLATDMVLKSSIYDVAILVSGDADYIPAIEAVKSVGKTVVSVDFLKEDGETLPGGARKLKLVCDEHFSISNQDMKRFLGYT